MRLLNTFTRFSPRTLCSLLPPSRDLPDSGGGGSGPFDPNNGGTPSTPSGPANIANVPISGGLVGEGGLIAYPLLNTLGVVITSYVDTTDFNCEADSYYVFPITDLKPGADVTIKRLRVRYRNLGICKVTFSISGMYSDATPKQVTLGDPNITNGERKSVRAIADNRLYNAYVDIIFTDQAPQIEMFRAAGAGPLSIVSITGLGEVHQSKE